MSSTEFSRPQVQSSASFKQRPQFASNLGLLCILIPNQPQPYCQLKILKSDI
jgi:hypothetical protein